MVFIKHGVLFILCLYASDMYLSAGEYMKAVTLMADNSWTQKLVFVYFANLIVFLNQTT